MVHVDCLQSSKVLLFWRQDVGMSNSFNMNCVNFHNASDVFHCSFDVRTPTTEQLVDSEEIEKSF